MKLIMVTRKVDAGDALAGFAYNWVKKIGDNLEKLYVVSWQKSDGSGLPDNVEVISLPENKWQKVLAMQKILWRLLPKVDGVFCHMNPEYTILSAPLAMLLGKRVVSWYAHKAVTWRRMVMEILTNKILTPSVESFRKPLFKNKVSVVGHGIDVDWFVPVEKKNDKSDFTIISVGRIAPIKNYESIIVALMELDSGVRLKIIGDALLVEHIKYLESLRDLVKRNNLEDRVEFVGWIPNKDMVSFYQNADLFINASNTGSVDKVVLEAMASGCMVLTSNEAFGSIVGEEFMFEKGNVTSLVDKIRFVMNFSDDKENKIRSDFRRIICGHHNLSKLSSKIVWQFCGQKKYFKKIKLELFYVKKAFFEYHHGLKYIINKHILAPKILKYDGVLEKSITNPDISMHMLVCHKDVIPSLWSLGSFYSVSRLIGKLFIHSDGTLTENDKNIFARFFPSASIIDAGLFVDKYSEKLNEYSALKEFRMKYQEYFSFKKIIDPYFVSDKQMRLILDSDIVWFASPNDLEEQVALGCLKSQMQDNVIPIFATFNDGSRTNDYIARANAGIMCYHINNFSIQRFEEFLNKIDLNNRQNLHFADQAGHAFSLNNLEYLPVSKYPIKGSVGAETIARHYTSPRRPLFYIEGLEKIKHILKNGTANK